jgi:hypothetical protein
MYCSAFCSVGLQVDNLKSPNLSLDEIYQFFSFIVKVIEMSIRKRRIKWGLLFKKIGDDVIAQKPMTSLKQDAIHRMAFF